MASTPSLAILLIVSSWSIASNLRIEALMQSETVQDGGHFEMLKIDVET
jgi:hypothetical protein